MWQTYNNRHTEDNLDKNPDLEIEKEGILEDIILLEAMAWEKTSSTSGVSESENSMVVVKRALLIGGDECGSYNWYLVNVSSSGGLSLQGQGQGQQGGNKNNKNKERKGLSQPRRLESFWSSRNGCLVSFARIGSTLYCVGGASDDLIATSDVYIADMGNHNHKQKTTLQWTKIATNMLTKRQSPETVVVDDKLYVFGGFYVPTGVSPSETWGEVYDPNQKHKGWRPLRQPPSFFNGEVMMFAVHDSSDDSSMKTKILLGSITSDYLFSYDVVTDTWDIIADDFKFYSRATRPVLRHNKLYWIAHGIAVYDLQLKHMFTGPILGKFDYSLLHTPLDVHYGPVVFHIDRDEFCCIWIDGRVCCTTIRISEPLYKKGGKHSVKGHCLFTQRYLVHQPIFWPLFGMVLDGTFPAIDEAQKKKGVSARGVLEEVNHRVMSLVV